MAVKRQRRGVVGRLAQSVAFCALIITTMVGVQCMQVHVVQPITGDVENAHMHYESFTLIYVKENLKPTQCLTDGCKDKKMPDAINMYSKGSGAVIAHKGDETYIITAAHVCLSNTAPDHLTINGESYSFVSTVKITAIDYYGGKHESLVVGSDPANDVCILKTQNTWSRPIRFANSMPLRGEKIYNIAAPRGIFYPGMVLMFEGYYSGYDGDQRQFFSIPAGPGSSGSVILNSSGEIVSVVHSAAISFENLAIGSSLSSILKLLQDSGL
jgi:S1-C subfamily serine protease